VYVLASKKHYSLPASDIASALKVILRLHGFSLPRGQKRVYLNALDLYASKPELGFADAIIAATVARLRIPLATFDTDFGGLPGVTVLEKQDASAA
jgi:predicted nucleic acid-binding protein